MKQKKPSLSQSNFLRRGNPHKESVLSRPGFSYGAWVSLRSFSLIYHDALKTLDSFSFCAKVSIPRQRRWWVVSRRLKPRNIFQSGHWASRRLTNRHLVSPASSPQFLSHQLWSPTRGRREILPRDVFEAFRLKDVWTPLRRCSTARLLWRTRFSSWLTRIDVPCCTDNFPLLGNANITASIAWCAMHEPPHACIPIDWCQNAFAWMEERKPYANVACINGTNWPMALCVRNAEWIASWSESAPWNTNAQLSPLTRQTIRAQQSVCWETKRIFARNTRDRQFIRLCWIKTRAQIRGAGSSQRAHWILSTSHTTHTHTQTVHTHAHWRRTNKIITIPSFAEIDCCSVNFHLHQRHCLRRRALNPVINWEKPKKSESDCAEPIRLKVKPLHSSSFCHQAARFPRMASCNHLSAHEKESPQNQSQEVPCLGSTVACV